MTMVPMGTFWSGPALDIGAALAESPRRTATLVAPRVTPLALAKRTKMRFTAGSKGMLPVLATKIPKLGVAFVLIATVTRLLGVVGFTQTPVVRSVAHRETLSGSETAPVSAVTVSVSLLPTFTAATAKTPEPVLASVVTTPLLLRVAARATMSGTGVLDAESNNVLMPEMARAGSVLAQSNCNCTSVGGNVAVGVNAKTNVCAFPPGISTGVLVEPITALVVGSVVRKTKVAGTVVSGAMVQPVAVLEPVLIIVAKAVAGVPTWTERLLGSTAATSAWAPVVAGLSTRARSAPREHRGTVTCHDHFAGTV